MAKESALLLALFRLTEPDPVDEHEYAAKWKSQILVTCHVLHRLKFVERLEGDQDPIGWKPTSSLVYFVAERASRLTLEAREDRRLPDDIPLETAFIVAVRNVDKMSEADFEFACSVLQSLGLAKWRDDLGWKPTRRLDLMNMQSSREIVARDTALRKK